MPKSVQQPSEIKIIRMVFQRLCREGAHLFLKLGNRKGFFPLVAESEGRLALAISEGERQQWALKPGAHVLCFFLDRGKRFEAILEATDFGFMAEVECCFFEQPRSLKALDDQRFANHVPERPLSCIFTTVTNDVCQGSVRALGAEGIELRINGYGEPKAECLRIGGPTTVELNLDSVGRLLLQGTVTYLRETTAGILFREEVSPSTMKVYRGWVLDAHLTMLQKDREAFDPRGITVTKELASQSARPGFRAHVIVERDPLLLVIAETDRFPNRIANSLGRIFGIAALDYLQGNVQPQAASLGENLEGWGPVKLILVHHRLRLGSGMELARKLIQEEHCPLPVVIVGTEEDAELKHARALELGAKDYLPVEPFNALALKVALENVLKIS